MPTIRITAEEHRQLAAALNDGKPFESQADFLAAVERHGRDVEMHRRLRRLEAEAPTSTRCDLADARLRVAEEDAAEQRHLDAQLRADLRLLPGEELI
jgi:hypothetical protein